MADGALESAVGRDARHPARIEIFGGEVAVGRADSQPFRRAGKHLDLKASNSRSRGILDEGRRDAVNYCLATQLDVAIARME